MLDIQTPEFNVKLPKWYKEMFKALSERFPQGSVRKSLNEVSAKREWISGMNFWKAMEVEVSARLAVAIGWDGNEDVRIETFNSIADAGKSNCAVWFEEAWRQFSYKDLATFNPIVDCCQLHAELVCNANWQPLWRTQYQGVEVICGDKSESMAVALITATGADTKWKFPSTA